MLQYIASTIFVYGPWLNVRNNKYDVIIVTASGIYFGIWIGGSNTLHLSPVCRETNLTEWTMQQ